jgi:hypothetical protein
VRVADACGRAAALLALWGLAWASAACGDGPLRAFTPETWRNLLADRAHARVLVFTSTDCSYCPAEVDSISVALRHMPAPRPILAVVFMDGRDSARALLAGGEYGAAGETWAYDGDETAMRYRIDPAWRGETPYIGLLPPGGAPRFVLGHATAADLARLAKARPVTR